MTGLTSDDRIAIRDGDIEYLEARIDNLLNDNETLAEMKDEKNAEIVLLIEQVNDLEQRKDAAYLERNQCVALLARMALALGCKAGTAHTAIEGWSEDWHGCVYIDLPTGQVSWHFHDDHAPLFAGLPPYERAWDGHDTPEKYRRVQDAYIR